MREGETQEPCEKRDSRPETTIPGGFVVFFWKRLGKDVLEVL